MLRIVLCSLLALFTPSALACWSKRDFEEAKSNMVKQTEAAQAAEDTHARIKGTIKFTCTACKDTNTKDYDLPFSSLKNEHTLRFPCKGCSRQIIAPLGKYTVVSPKNAQ